MKNIPQQVYFYHHCRPINCALSKKMNFSAEIFKGFSHHIVTHTFWTPYEWLLMNIAAQPQEEYCKWNRLFYGALLRESMEMISMVKAILFHKNNFSCSREVNRFIIYRYFWFFSRILTKIVVNQAINDT